MIGLGVMGSAIARRLLAAGHPVRVYDVRPDAVAALAGEGAHAAATPADFAAGDLTVLSLNTAAIVEQAVFGPDGVLGAGRGGTLLVDMSSIDPTSTRELAERAARQGARWVDAPLSGGAPGALRGDLTLMLGGRDEDVARALPVLRALASRITHLGPAGAGQVGKLVNQVLVGCGFVALAEAAALVRAAGLPAEQVLAALTGGRADSALLREFFTKFAAVDLSPTGRVSNMVKDLETARDFAVANDLPLPLTTTTAELHRWLVARHHGGSDSAALMLYYLDGAQAC